jgi:hypothetical protein
LVKISKEFPTEALRKEFPEIKSKETNFQVFFIPEIISAYEQLDPPSKEFKVFEKRKIFLETFKKEKHILKFFSKIEKK